MLLVIIVGLLTEISCKHGTESYNKTMAFTISADEIKKTLPGYDPERSETFHRESARLADKQFEQALKARAEKTVVLMAGGTASGKSEYVSVYLQPRKVIILDGTLPSSEGAHIKIRKAQKAGKQVEVHLVIPVSLLVAFIAFLNRDRKFSLSHFYRTHSSSRKTVLEVAKAHTDIPIKIYISDVDFIGTDSTMSFQELHFSNRDELVEFLGQNQYTEEAIIKEVFNT